MSPNRRKKPAELLMQPKVRVLLTLLRGSEILTLSALIIRIIYRIHALHFDATYVVLIGAILYFYALESLARSRFATAALLLFSFSYLLIATFLAATWGALLPESILLYALTIVTATLLIGSYGGLLFMFLSALLLVMIVYATNQHILIPSTSWMNSLAGFGDVAVYVATFTLILTTGWLSNKAVNQALLEQDEMRRQLQLERDSLDERLQERTEELREQQRAEIDRIYRFAYFGRVASGLLHDMTGPISTISNTLRKLNQTESSEQMERAIRSSERVELLVSSARHELSHSKMKEEVSISQEIERVLSEYQEGIEQRKILVTTSFHGSDSITGDSVKLYRVMSNVILNAVEAIDEASPRRSVAISHKEQKGIHTITVQDTGKGIEPDALSMIFEPFFTTKSGSNGMGLGLSICREIINEFFAGDISVGSSVGVGTIVTIKLSAQK